MFRVIQWYRNLPAKDRAHADLAVELAVKLYEHKIQYLLPARVRQVIDIIKRLFNRG